MDWTRRELREQWKIDIDGGSLRDQEVVLGGFDDDYDGVDDDEEELFED